MEKKQSKQKKRKAIILGAGITGLKIGVELAKNNYEVVILEKANRIGGMAYSFRYKEFILDYGPHKFYSQIKGIMPEYKELLAKDCLVIEKTNSLYLLNTYFQFPPKLKELLLGINPLIMLKCAIGYCLAAGKGVFRKRNNISYEDYFINGFGEQGYRLLFKDFCWKVWGDPKIISEELARRRIPVPNIQEFIKDTITKKEKPDVSAKYFYYPKYGFGELADILAQTLQANNGKILLESSPIKIQTEKGKAVLLLYKQRDGRLEKINDFDIIISTIDITDLITLFEPKVNENIINAASKLRYRALRLCYLIFEKERALKNNWLFFPEKEICFNRVSEQKSFSPFTCPHDKTFITAEITCDEKNDFYEKKDTEIRELVINDLEKVAILKKQEVKEFFTKKIEKAYPLYTIDFRDYLNIVLDYIHGFDNCYTIGRQGLFNYNNTDHCIDMANKTAQHILRNGSRREWEEIVRNFDEYKIVD